MTLGFFIETKLEAMFRRLGEFIYYNYGFELNGLNKYDNDFCNDSADTCVYYLGGGHFELDEFGKYRNFFDYDILSFVVFISKFGKINNRNHYKIYITYRGCLGTFRPQLKERCFVVSCDDDCDILLENILLSYGLKDCYIRYILDNNKKSSYFSKDVFELMEGEAVF